MTSEEAKQKIISRERDIKNAYNGLWSAAKEVGTTGNDAALREKNRIVNDASGNTMKKTGAALLLSLLGIILLGMSHPGWGVLFIIIGIVVAYNVYQFADKEADKRIAAANSALSEVSSRQSQLNSALDSNKTI